MGRRSSLKSEPGQEPSLISASAGRVQQIIVCLVFTDWIGHCGPQADISSVKRQWRKWRRLRLNRRPSRVPPPQLVRSPRRRRPAAPSPCMYTRFLETACLPASHNLGFLHGRLREETAPGHSAREERHDQDNHVRGRRRRSSASERGCAGAGCAGGAAPGALGAAAASAARQRHDGMGQFGEGGVGRVDHRDALSGAAARPGRRPLRHGARRHRRHRLRQSGLPAGAVSR